MRYLITAACRNGVPHVYPWFWLVISFPTKFAEALPLIIRGIHTTVKADLQNSGVEMLFETSPRVRPKLFYEAQYVKGLTPDYTPTPFL